MAKIFFDTSILVYTVDKKEHLKNKAALELLKRVADDDSPVISTQVLQEFYYASTTKLKIDKIIIKNLVHSYKNMEIVTTDLLLIEQAIDISILFSLAFWDSLIVAAAERAHCAYLISEDLHDGQKIRGIRLVNPFKNPDFPFS